MPRLSPTALGAKALAFVILVWIAFFAAPYTNLYFLWLCFFGALAGVAALAACRNMIGVRAELLVDEPATAGVSIDLRLVLDAGDRPRRRLRVTVWFGKEMVVACHIATSEGNRVHQVRLPARGRGVHPLTRVVLSTDAPLGLVRASIRVIAPKELIVQPRVLSPERLPRLAAHPNDREADVAGLRAYRPGDDLREVHGRASARRNSPVIREREPHRTEGVILLLDRRCDGSELERRLQIVAGFAERCARQGAPLRLVTQDLDATFGKDARAGTNSFSELGRWLAGANQAPAGAALPSLREPALVVADLAKGAPDVPVAAPAPATPEQVPAARWALLALVLVNLGFVAITGAVSLPWVLALIGITLGAPLLSRYRNTLTWRTVWNISVLGLFLVLLRDVLSSSVLSLLEDGLVLAAFCQVHLVNNLHRDQKPDLLILNSAMIGVVTAFFCQDLSYSPLFAGYVVALFWVLDPGPGAAWRSLTALALAGLAFVILPRDFDRAGFAMDALRNLQSRTIQGDGPQDKIPLVREHRALGSDAVVMRGSMTSGMAPGQPIHLRSGTYTLLEPDGWQPTRGRQRSGGAGADDPWITRSPREWSRLRGDSNQTLRLQMARRDVTHLPAPLEAIRVKVLDAEFPMGSSIRADGTIRCVPGPGPEIFAWEIELGNERIAPAGKVRAKVPVELLPYTWLPPSAMTRGAEDLHARYTARVRPGADQHEIVEAIRSGLSSDRNYALPGEPGFAGQLEAFIAGNGAGHCEHFAGALAILLRMARIPCRLAAGWLVDEWNESRSQVVVRDKHAHAWVEVCDPEAGWYAVDATPAREARTRAEGDWLGRLGDAASRAWALVTGFSSGSRVTLFEHLLTWPALISVAVLGALVYLLRRRKRTQLPPPVRSWRSAVARAGLVQRPGETPREVLTRARSCGVRHDRMASLEAATSAHEQSRYAGESDLA